MDENQVRKREVRLTVNKALAYRNLRAAQKGEKPITLHSLARLCGVAATTVHRLTRDPETDAKAASALSLDLASRIVSVLECDIDEILEIKETEEYLDVSNAD